MPAESKDRYISPLRVKYVCEVQSDPDSGDDGYYTPYAQYLEAEIEFITEILGRLILEHGEHKPIEALLAEIEQWMGDDWDVDLSDEDQKRLDAIKGWTYDWKIPKKNGKKNKKKSRKKWGKI